MVFSRFAGGSELAKPAYCQDKSADSRPFGSLVGGVFPAIRPEGLYQRSNVTLDHACNHALTAVGLKLACSEGLGEAADDDGIEALEVLGRVKGLEVGVGGSIDGSKVGDPVIPNSSFLLSVEGMFRERRVAAARCSQPRN
jgi:hypothetical protein